MNLKELKNRNGLLRKVSDNETLDESKDFEIINTTDKEFIVSHEERIWNLLLLSYNNNILGMKEQKNVRKSTALLSYVESEGEIIACSLYGTYLGGLKAMYVGCDQTEKGKAALYAILHRDASDDGDIGYWVEASDVIEHLMAKFNASPIPNVYAEYLLRKPVVLDDDKVHYIRQIGLDNDECRKMIFGFRDKEFYNKVVNFYENYTEFKTVMNNKISNKIKDSTYPEDYPTYIVEDLDIVNILIDAYQYDMLDCLTDNMYNYLMIAKTELEKYYVKKPNPQVRGCIDFAELLLELPRLECHKI